MARHDATKDAESLRSVTDVPALWSLAILLAAVLGGGAALGSTIYRIILLNGRPGPVSAQWELTFLAWFAFVIAIEWAARRSVQVERTARLRTWLYASSVIAVGYALFTWSIVFARPSAVAWPYYVATAMSVPVFLVSSTAKPARLGGVMKALGGDLWFVFRAPVTLLLAAILVATVGYRDVRASSTRGKMGQEFVDWFHQQPRAQLPGDDGKAAVVFAEFYDYQCPACATAARYYADMIAGFSAELGTQFKRLEFDYPLDAECNPYAISTQHDAACEAAAAMRLARLRGTAPALEEWLWQHQANLTGPEVFAAARDIAGVTDLPERYPALLRDIATDVALGKQLQVGGTPAFFLNGVMLRLTPKTNIQLVVENLRAKAKAAELW